MPFRLQFPGSALLCSLVGCFTPDGGAQGDNGGTASDGSTSGDPTGDSESGNPATGDPTGDPTTADATGSGDDQGDTTSPTLISVSPENGAMGVLADVAFVLEFSEPMDTAATEAAYQSPELPSSQVSFAWNGQGSVLTIVPNDPLVHASGSDDSVVAETYSFSLMASATDLAGNELENPVDVSFSTARRITMQLAPDSALSGITNPGGMYSEAGWYAVGDWGNLYPPGSLRSPLTFDISGVPEPIVEWVAVTFELMQTGGLGNAYAAHGNIHVHDATYATFDVAAGENPGDDLGLLSDAFVEGEWNSLDVTDAVAADHPGPHTQFLLMFDGENPGSNTAADSVEGQLENIHLAVEVLVH